MRGQGQDMLFDAPIEQLPLAGFLPRRPIGKKNIQWVELKYELFIRKVETPSRGFHVGLAQGPESQESFVALVCRHGSHEIELARSEYRIHDFDGYSPSSGLRIDPKEEALARSAGNKTVGMGEAESRNGEVRLPNRFEPAVVAGSELPITRRHAADHFEKRAHQCVGGNVGFAMGSGKASCGTGDLVGPQNTLPARQNIGVDEVDLHRPDQSRIIVRDHVSLIRAKSEASCCDRGVEQKSELLGGTQDNGGASANLVFRMLRGHEQPYTRFVHGNGRKGHDAAVHAVTL